jgi:phosphoserine phosphatase
MEERSSADTNEGIAVIDVCDTLYFSNTTHDFIDFVARHERSNHRLLYVLLNSRVSPLRYALIGLSVFTGWDYLRTFNIGMLKGRRRDEVQDLAERFVRECLNDRKVPVTHRIVDDYRSARKGRIVLCSSSIEPVVAAVAKELAVDGYVCTTLELSDGIYTGLVADEVYHDKLNDLGRAGISSPIDLAISDNLSDLKLLKSAKTCFAIAHSDQKREFWKKHQVELIDPKG